MKHGTNPRRLRSRNNGKRHPTPRHQLFESSGPDGKIRGTAQQVLDRYLALARDASSAGDIIAAESFFQFAEHYYRVMNGEGFADRSVQRNRQGEPEEAPPAPADGVGEAPAAAGAEQPEPAGF